MLRSQPIQHRNHPRMRQVGNRNRLRKRPRIRIEPAAMQVDQHPVRMHRRRVHRIDHPHRNPGNRLALNLHRIDRPRFLARANLPLVRARPPLLQRLRQFASEARRASRACASGLIVFGTGTTRRDMRRSLRINHTRILIHCLLRKSRQHTQPSSSPESHPKNRSLLKLVISTEL